MDVTEFSFDILSQRLRELAVQAANGTQSTNNRAALDSEVDQLLQQIDDIESIVLRASDGTPVYLRDVADVKIGPQTRQGAVTQDGRGETVAAVPAVLPSKNPLQAAS